ncbi:MAG: NADH-quinone oxidoreductase subunit A [Deltaproteobacteria bacterium]|nr:NADH-quinone oxidoreductase subunit A [Deltaproteobacteria bacterium]
MIWIFFIGVCVIVGSMLGAYFLGSQKFDRAAKVPYESGIAITGSARTRVPIHFYVVAMLFVIFDLESIFVYAWSVSIRELGWRGFSQIFVFIAVLLLGLAYLIKNKALDFGPKFRKPGESL